MVRLKWDNEDSPMYQTGVSQGVFYGDDGVGHAWSGLISVTEKPQNNAPTAVYNAMGEKYDNFGNVAEKKHGLACYIYPEVMDDYLGYEYLEDFGFTVDERPPKKFHMAYRVELGNGLYEIHVLLNQIATFGETARQTITDSSALSTITMNLEGAVDPRLGTSHIRLDSRLPITKSAEALLFGDQYTDANIHDFLTAEPVWETVATNYAPIIEPDYDNYVWLGGANLFDPANYSHHSNVGYSSNSITSAVIEVEPFTTYTITIKNKQTNRLGIYQDPLVDGIHSGYVDKTVLSQPEFLETTKGSDYVRTVTTTDNGGYMILYLSNEGTYEHSDLIKVELGSTSTPWIPHTSDPDQKPRALDPYPENYKPGIKGGITGVWSVGFYDEKNKGLGVYSRSRTAGSSRLLSRLLPVDQLLGSSVSVKSDVVIDEPVSGPTVHFSRIAVSQGSGAAWTNTAPNIRGVHHISGSTDNMTAAISSHEHVFYYHGGIIDSGTITYRNTMVSTDPDLDFFDVNTTPPTKGDRYVRVETSGGDYTIHQQLRLRSTAKVKLSDITQYDFWLEAADSMLLSQNETFTFNGPQAVINGDTFTIDDSIQGYAEG